MYLHLVPEHQPQTLQAAAEEGKTEEWVKKQLCKQTPVKNTH